MRLHSNTKRLTHWIFRWLFNEIARDFLGNLRHRIVVPDTNSLISRLFSKNPTQTFILENADSFLSVLFAKNWGGNRVIRVTKLSLHEFPRLNYIVFNSTAHMPRPRTILKIALNATSFVRSAFITMKTVSLLIDKSTQGFSIFVEPDFWCPIDTNSVSPLELLP